MWFILMLWSSLCSDLLCTKTGCSRLSFRVPPSLPSTYIIYKQMFYFPKHTQDKQQLTWYICFSALPFESLVSPAAWSLGQIYNSPSQSFTSNSFLLATLCFLFAYLWGTRGFPHRINYPGSWYSGAVYLWTVNACFFWWTILCHSWKFAVLSTMLFIPFQNVQVQTKCSRRWVIILYCLDFVFGFLPHLYCQVTTVLERKDLEKHNPQ